MDDSPDRGMGDGHKAESEPSKAAGRGDGGKPQAGSVESYIAALPVVWSPRLESEDEIEPVLDDAGEGHNFDFDAHEMSNFDAEASAPPEDSVTEESAGATGGDAAPAAKPLRSARFALLAASIALAAACGSFIGSISASGLVGLFHEAAPASNSEEFSATMQAMKAQFAQLSSIKSDVDGANHNATAQFAKIADRLDRVEHAEADPAAKLSHIADAVDRLDKQSAAAPETTGSITATPPPSDPKTADKVVIVDGWIVEDVHGGQALVANRHGGEFLVGPGTMLPGLGPVEAVKRQDGQWIVLTARGVIPSGR